VSAVAFVVQTSMGEKNSVNTRYGSLNTFGRNEIEVAPISSALLRIACLVILYKTSVPDHSDGFSKQIFGAEEQDLDRAAGN
jgi:hypothetical protein